MQSSGATMASGRTNASNSPALTRREASASRRLVPLRCAGLGDPRRVVVGDPWHKRGDKHQGLPHQFRRSAFCSRASRSTQWHRKLSTASARRTRLLRNANAMTGLQTLSSKWPRDRQRHGLRADREMHENVASVRPNNASRAPQPARNCLSRSASR